MSKLTSTRLEAISARVSALEAAVAQKSGHKNPDYYKTKKECDMMTIIYQLANGLAEGTEEYLDFSLLDALVQGGGKQPVVQVQKGDTLMELLTKYADVKDVVNKIKVACEKAGLTLNMTTGKVE